MKIGKQIIMLLVVCILCMTASNVFAEIPVGMSDELKSILNEEGQLVITDTIAGDDKAVLLADEICKYSTDSWFVGAFFIGDSREKATIYRWDVSAGIELERFDIDVVFEEKYSEDFKEITENGEIIITSSNIRGKAMAVQNYCYTKETDEEIHFMVSDMNEETGICTIRMYKRLNPDDVGTKFVEQHKVKVIFEEKFSDEFNKVAKDGKIIIQASRDEKKQNLLYTYASLISNYDADGEYVWYAVTDINDDATKCTMQRYEEYKEGDSTKSRMIEEHIVSVEYKKEISDYFKSKLNKDGKFVIDSIKPKNMDEWISMYEVLYYNNGIMADTEFLAEDFSKCEITILNDKGIPETHMVEFEYKYDAKIQEIADNMMKDINKEEAHFFYVKDLELINYWINSGYEEDRTGSSNFDNYSGELKAFVNYKNFSLEIDDRMGADDDFFTMRGGIGLLKYKGTTYYINPILGVWGNHIIYVPTETESTKEALAAAVQKRVDEYIGEGKVKITAGEGTVEDYYKNYSSSHIAELKNKIAEEKAKEKPNNNLIRQYENEIDWYKNYYVEEYVKESYNNPNGEHYFLQSAEGNFWFVATIDGVDYEFIVIKDSSKMITPTYKVADINTNVEISSKSTEIPLDTSIDAEKITSGGEYEKIIKVLGIKENAMFDLNLFSKSLNEYVKKLADGSFEVRIPIPENLKNKKLAIYYVDENNNIEEYEVKVEDEYAVFTTKHFSTYTLAEEIVADEKLPSTENNNNSNNTNNDVKPEDTNNSEEKVDKIEDKIEKEENINNPSTGDNVMMFVAVFAVSIVGLIVTLCITRKKQYNK